jgi:hypothetical protein
MKMMRMMNKKMMRMIKKKMKKTMRMIKKKTMKMMRMMNKKMMRMIKKKMRMKIVKNENNEDVVIHHLSLHFHLHHFHHPLLILIFFVALPLPPIIGKYKINLPLVTNVCNTGIQSLNKQFYQIKYNYLFTAKEAIVFLQEGFIDQI